MSDRLFKAAAQLLFMAILALVCMLMYHVMGQGVVVDSFGGLAPADGEGNLVRFAYAFDLIFPIFYGSGLIVLVTALQADIAPKLVQRETRPLARIVILAIFIAMVSDLIENRFISELLLSKSPKPSFVGAATILKYTLLAFASVGVSLLMPKEEGWARLLRLLLQYGVPIAVAFMVAFPGVSPAREIGGAMLFVLLAGLAWYAWRRFETLQTSLSDIKEQHLVTSDIPAQHLSVPAEAPQQQAVNEPLQEEAPAHVAVDGQEPADGPKVRKKRKKKKKKKDKTARKK